MCGSAVPFGLRPRSAGRGRAGHRPIRAMHRAAAGARQCPNQPDRTV
ncbi:MAG TPA: hypothetical protein VMZ31_00510 [Phycisphaerae bacterium]|nr:hypothetical protein [Phycisphaerae bacterium]